MNGMTVAARAKTIELDAEVAAAVQIVMRVRRALEPFDAAARARVFFYVADYFRTKLGDPSR